MEDAIKFHVFSLAKMIFFSSRKIVYICRVYAETVLLPFRSRISLSVDFLTFLPVSSVWSISIASYRSFLFVL